MIFKTEILAKMADKRDKKKENKKSSNMYPSILDKLKVLTGTMLVSMWKC